MATAEKISRIQICGTFVELYKLIPAPRDMGRFFIASREKWQRKCRVLYSGLTQGSANCFPEKIDPAAILKQIALKKKKKPITLRREGKKYLLS
ncbi:MAG: hypothetical protein A2Y82_00745 [Candidatus Buchananbacteria bacterium RBG_13_36_9]|uniref:Uncharacterized protein n=1 Tax=Candidatus Buchananbacteria bacterium RBG_13_36_9 TaxID=1797530 RepID=A0A1G1XN70_9BACT|nr:MAG: hypothetical protein A2Y82_00745 [Candidatus Buchananbacteria bacterium RBG_13_36_9]